MRALPKDYKLQSTSFHGTVIITTPNKLIGVADKLGAKYYDQNDGKDKTNFDFEFLTDEGDVFTVYDWKEYRPLGMDEWTEFHIGAIDKRISDQGAYELKQLF